VTLLVIGMAVCDITSPHIISSSTIKLEMRRSVLYQLMY